MQLDGRRPRWCGSDASAMMKRFYLSTKFVSSSKLMFLTEDEFNNCPQVGIIMF